MREARAGAPAARAVQEVDYGRRGKGYIFGAFRPATGEALTHDDLGRTTASWVDFLERVEAWVPAAVERVYAILDNLSVHRAPDALLFSLAHPRWEFVFQPRYAAYLNLIEPCLIEPWWKTHARPTPGVHIGVTSLADECGRSVPMIGTTPHRSTSPGNAIIGQ